MPVRQGLLEEALLWRKLTIEKALDGKGILGRYRDLRFTKTLFAERQLRVTIVKQQNRDSVLQGWCS